MAFFSRFSRLKSSNVELPKSTTESPDTPDCKAGLKHIAMIMDGNGRWAKQRGMPRIAGHKKGAEALKKLLPACKKLGIEYLTVYAFSSENWRRPEEEISDLMLLLKSYIQAELDTLISNNIRLHIIGDISRLPADIQDMAIEAEKRTQKNDQFHLSICLNYGSRQETLNATRSLVNAVQSGSISVDDITEETLTQHLYTSALPEPDLLIRTGGEKRLSNFLLWQIAYTELHFSDTLWPDFNAEELTSICQEFSTRERRYGGI